MKTLTPYEQEQIQQIHTWKKAPPTFFSRASHAFWGLPDWLNSRLAKNGVVLSTLKAANNAAKALTDKKDIQRSAQVEVIDELKRESLDVCDKHATNVQNWAIAISATEGFATGMTGVWGLAVDIPFTITFALRTVHKIGLCYGFEPTEQQDDWFAMAILSTACANNQNDKKAALRLMHQHIQPPSKKKKVILEEDASSRILFNLATQINLNLAQRKALQVIPVVGTAAGLTVNALFIHDICVASRRAFQERWFRLHNKFKEPKEYDTKRGLLGWRKNRSNG